MRDRVPFRSFTERQSADASCFSRRIRLPQTGLLLLLPHFSRRLRGFDIWTFTGNKGDRVIIDAVLS